MRINARLDDEHSQKLEKLKNINNLSVSDVIKKAIDLMYEQQNEAPRQKAQALLESDFIGIGAAEADLSSNYKQYVREAMERKYDPRG